jgi:CheY-like chemotaxis protein
MADSPRARILIVDDEEAILETMVFTFEDDYDVLTARSAPRGLELLDQHPPVAAVISDQRMPEMTGVEFLAEVCERHPSTVRIILTGFADMDAIIQAINAGHVYAYITKPWEPAELKQVVRRAVEHHRLTLENEHLLRDLREANAFLEAVMDRLDTGAIAVDGEGLVRAINRPASSYVGIDGEPRGRPLREVLEASGGGRVADAVDKLCGDPEVCFEELDLSGGGEAHRLRISVQGLPELGGGAQGRVVLMREISHEPLRQRFNELLSNLAAEGESLRPGVEKGLTELRVLAEQVRQSRIDSPGMAEQGERISRTQTALEHWLAVDDALANEPYPDAQLLRERMRVAMARWPLPDRIPERVRELARRVEAYYESGENPKQPIL